MKKKKKKKNEKIEMLPSPMLNSTTKFSINFEHSSSDGKTSWIALIVTFLVILAFLWGIFGAFME